MQVQLARSVHMQEANSNEIQGTTAEIMNVKRDIGSRHTRVVIDLRVA